MRMRSIHFAMCWSTHAKKIIFVVMAAKKRAHTSLSIDTKIKILDQVGKKSYKLISEEFGIGASNISDIKRNGDKLRDHKRKMTEMGCSRVAKSMRVGKDEELDMAAYLWFKQKREDGVPISGKTVVGSPLYCEASLLC